MITTGTMIFIIIMCALIVAGFFAYVYNIVVLGRSLFDMKITVMNIVQIFGIVLPLLGVVLGAWFFLTRKG